MPVDELEGGVSGEGTDTSGSSTGGPAGVDSGADSGDDAGAVSDSDGSGGDGNGSGGDDDGGGDGPAKSMGPGDAITKAATEAYRKLTGTEKPRDKNTGRFQKGPPAKQTDKAVLPPPADEKPKQPGVIDPDRVPDSWTAEAKALWQTLPPRAKAEINKREADYRNGHARLNQQIEQTRPHVELANMLGTTAQPYLQMFNERGLDLGAGLRDSVHTMAILNFGDNNQKVALLKRLVTAFQIDVKGTGGQQPGNPQPQPQPAPQPQVLRDPRVDALMAEREQTQTAARQKTIDDFVADPAHEHFQLVFEDMAKLVESRVAPDMQTAYDMAVKLNPAASAATAKKIAEKHAAEAAAAAAEARRAVGVRTGGKPAGNAPQPGKQNRQDVITSGVRAFLQSTGRV